MKTLRPKESGFTVVELILAIVVIPVMLVSLNGIVNNYVHLGNKSTNTLLANYYVEGKVESLRNVGFNGLSNGTTDLTSDLPGNLSSPKSANMTISNYSTDIKQIDISVSYNDQGATRTYSYTTLIGEIGVGE